MNLLWNYVGFYFAKATLWKRVWGEMCERVCFGMKNKIHVYKGGLFCVV
jgi:hypothetical protein